MGQRIATAAADRAEADGRTCVGNTRYLARPPCNYIIAQSRGGRTNQPTSLSISLLQFSPPRDSFSPLLHFILRWTGGHAGQTDGRTSPLISTETHYRLSFERARLPK